MPVQGVVPQIGSKWVRKDSGDTVIVERVWEAIPGYEHKFNVDVTFNGSPHHGIEIDLRYATWEELFTRLEQPLMDQVGDEPEADSPVVVSSVIGQ